MATVVARGKYKAQDTILSYPEDVKLGFQSVS